MPNLILKNKDIDNKDILWKRFFPPKGKEDKIPITYLTNDQIKQVLAEGTPYFAVSRNKLIINLEPSDSDTEEFVFLKGIEENDVREVSAQLYFKFTDNKTSNFERDDFLVPSTSKKSSVFNTTINPKVDISEKRITLDVQDIKSALLKKFNDLKVVVPKYGILSLVFAIHPKSKRVPEAIRKMFDASNEIEKAKKTGNQSKILKAISDFNAAAKRLADIGQTSETYRILVKCSLDTPHVAPKTTPPPPKIEIPNLQKANFISSPFVYDTFFIPQLSSSFVYNFYEPTEEDISVYADSRKYDNKKLSEIPKYIELNWKIPPKENVSDDSANVQKTAQAEQRTKYTKPADTFSIGGKRYSISTKSDVVNSFRSSISRTTSARSARNRFASVLKQVKSKTGTSSVSPVVSARTEAGTRFNEMLNSSISLIEQSEANRFADSRDVLIRDNSENEIEKFITNGNSLIKNKNVPDAMAGANEISRYVGYVIIKERLRDLQSENFEKIETIIIPDITKTRYVDTKIAYGEVYRYKIRTIYKFINKKKLPMFDDPDIVLNEDQIKNNFLNTTTLHNAFYFDSKFSNDVEVPAVEEVRPDAPFNFVAIPNSKDKTIFLTWNQKQQQKDIVGYNVYKKEISGSFERVNQNIIPPRNNFYLDKDVDYGKEYIYAIQSFDLHDNPSKLTFQIKTSLKLQDFQDIVKENENKVDVPYSLEFGESPEQEVNDTINFLKNIKIVINPLYLNLDRNVNYLLKFTSLDSFIEKEIKLNFKTKIITHRSSELDPEAINRAESLRREIQQKERERFGYTEEEVRRLKPDTGFDDNNGR